jgi:hypothetical protein
MAANGWRMVQEGVKVKLARYPDTGETVVLCRSADRRNKERAMQGQVSWHIVSALGRLADRIAHPKKHLDAAGCGRTLGLDLPVGELQSLRSDRKC